MNPVCPQCGSSAHVRPWVDHGGEPFCWACMQPVAVDMPTEREKALAEAIRTHRSQKADDRCIEDDDRLYETLGDGIKCDRRVGSKAMMVANCMRFIERRCEGGGWPSYAELESTNKALAIALEALLAAHSEPPLIRYEKEWNAAVEAGYAALAKMPTEPQS